MAAPHYDLGTTSAHIFCLRLACKLLSWLWLLDLSPSIAPHLSSLIQGIPGTHRFPTLRPSRPGEAHAKRVIIEPVT